MEKNTDGQTDRQTHGV